MLVRGRVDRLVVIIWGGAVWSLICKVMALMAMIQLLFLLFNAGQRHRLHPAGHGGIVCIVGLGHVVPPLPFHAPVCGETRAQIEAAASTVVVQSSFVRLQSDVAATTHACEASVEQPMVGRGAAVAASPARVSGREPGVDALEQTIDSTRVEQSG